eukprot:CAMPEP_0119051454 /NCGR_PEP_ID=MMETSP1177-20130426/73063_1 /TAXON_ID=2985 /ORGANISM="Ochromonas sp, Strain CCMP1899" /LENGTH=81 /DNA_ID=CAMNT_0007030659 /DNA_START=1405 /DNA_END=1650 /DNA_ORIENTATION=-
MDEGSEYSLFDNDHISDISPSRNGNISPSRNRHSKSNGKNGDYHGIDINKNDFDTDMDTSITDADNSITVNPMTLSVKSGN